MALPAHMVGMKTPTRGQCRHCMSRRDVYSISRSGGSTYRRGGRSYSSSICGECAVSLLFGWSPGQLTASGFSARGLVLIVREIDTDEAREALTQADIRERAEESQRDGDRTLTQAYFDRAAERRLIGAWIRYQTGHWDYQKIDSAFARGEFARDALDFFEADDGTWTWTRTLTEQVIDHLRHDARIDPSVRQQLVDGLSAGLHLPKDRRP